MAVEVTSESNICYRCGKRYSKWRTIFPVTYGLMYKGMGRLPYCRDCIDIMYANYLTQCDEPKDAVRQMCRKLDLYWSESVFEQASAKSTPRSVMLQYITKLNAMQYAGKSYDDTLFNEGTLWSFRLNNKQEEPAKEPESEPEPVVVEPEPEEPVEEEEVDDYVAPQEVIDFWGQGYTNAMYHQLEQRLQYWKGLLPEESKSDVGTEALIRQICAVELDINKDRAAGKSVDKMVNTLNTLLGSLNLKPTQRKDDNDAAYDNTPFGVWIRRFENEKPVPEPDPELKDVDGIIHYILVWLYGHLGKMLGIKNVRSRMYEEEIAKLRVERPEYDDEDDEAMLDDIFGDSDTDG